MAITAIKWAPTAVAFAGTWGSAANAATRIGGTYATWTSTTTVATATLELQFGSLQSLVPSGATVTNVNVTSVHKCAPTAQINTLTGRIYSGTTALGTGTQALTKSATDTVDSVQITSSLPTWAQLSDMRFRYVALRNTGTTSSTVSFDRAWIQVTYTYPTGDAPVLGAYTIFGNAVGDATSQTGGPYQLATQFSVLSNAKYLIGMRFWRPPDLVITSTGIEGALFPYPTGAEVSGTRIAFGALSGSGWMERYYSTPVPLTPGNQYLAVGHFPSNYMTLPLACDAIDLGNGPVIAGAGENGWFGTSATMAIPTTAQTNQWYWVDPIVSDLPKAALLASQRRRHGKRMLVR